MKKFVGICSVLFVELIIMNLVHIIVTGESRISLHEWIFVSACEIILIIALVINEIS